MFYVSFSNAGTGQPTTPGRFNPAGIKQETTENPGPVTTVTPDSLQEHSLDLSVKDHG